jgi:hypothetical protein
MDNEEFRNHPIFQSAIYEGLGGYARFLRDYFVNPGFYGMKVPKGTEASLLSVFTYNIS